MEFFTSFDQKEVLLVLFLLCLLFKHWSFLLSLSLFSLPPLRANKEGLKTDFVCSLSPFLYPSFSFLSNTQSSARERLGICRLFYFFPQTFPLGDDMSSFSFRFFRVQARSPLLQLLTELKTALFSVHLFNLTSTRSPRSLIMTKRRKALRQSKKIE